MNFVDRATRRFGFEAFSGFGSDAPCSFDSDVPSDEQAIVLTTEAEVSNRSKKRREYGVFIRFLKKQQ